MSRKTSIGCFAILLVLLALELPAWAGYIPPRRPSAPGGGGTTTTGRRGGCQGDEAASLTALAPQSHVGQTISTHPTFAWYVPTLPATNATNSLSIPVEFQLYTPTATGQQVIYETQLPGTSGIMSLSVPDDQPGLEVGKIYHWQVVLLCNPNRPSSALVTGAQIEVVDASQFPELSQTDDLDTTDRSQQANRYAEAGLWYDAIAEAVRSPVTTALQTVEQDLLTSLAQLEADNGQTDRSTQLQQIITLITSSRSE